MSHRYGQKVDTSPAPAAGGGQMAPYSIGSSNMASRSPDPYGAAAAAGGGNTSGYGGGAAASSGGRGRSQSESANFEHALESQGLTSASVELGLLQSKLRSAHGDLQRSRAELKEAQERSSALSAQLNQQKIENSSLTHQYSALLAKLTDAEASARRFDEEIATERSSHQATREVLENERNLATQREQSLNQHITAMENKLQHMQHTSIINSHDITSREAQQRGGGGGGARGGAAAGLNRDSGEESTSAHDRYVRLSEVLAAQLDGTLEQLLAQLSEDESGVFVTKSMVMSTASELESRLAQAEFKLRGAALSANDVRDVDDQVVAFTSSLLGENKELWNNVCRLQQEADALQQELNAGRHRERGLTEAAPLREHIAYLEQQNAALEEAARACRQVVDEQTDKAREHEVAAQRIMDELRILTQKYEALLQDRNSLQKVLDEACATAQEATAETEQLREDNGHLRNENHAIRSRNETIEHEMRTDSDLRINELIEKIRAAQAERDEAQRDRDQLGFQLDECRGTDAELRRIIAQRDETIADLQRALEEMRQECLSTLEHQITAQRAVYQKEIDELRAQVADLSARNHAPPGLVEDLRNEIKRLEAEQEMQRGAIRDRENDALLLKDTLRQTATEKEAAEERERDVVQRATASDRERERIEAEMRRLAAAVEAESGRHGTKLQAAEAEVGRLQEQLLESERSRQQHMEELRLTRQSMQGGGISDDTLRQLRLKYEKDRAEMAAENERLQQQLRQLHQKHIELLEQNRGGSVGGSAGVGGQTAAAQHAREASNMQAKLEAQTRKLNEVDKRREDLEADKRKMAEHIRALQAEKQVLETRMDHIVTQVRKEQELDLGGPVRTSMGAHRRLQDQIGEMDSALRGGSSSGVRPSTAAPSPAPAAAGSSTAFPRRPPPTAVGGAATSAGPYGGASGGGGSGAGTPTTATAPGSHWRP